ncbi:17403_t:CDS:1, partial [Gigaspora rosea]
WCNAFRFAGSERERKEDTLIRNEFETADKIISTLSSTQKHSDAIYSSRLLNSCLDLEQLPTLTLFKLPSDGEESP